MLPSAPQQVFSGRPRVAHTARGRTGKTPTGRRCPSRLVAPAVHKFGPARQRAPAARCVCAHESAHTTGRSERCWEDTQWRRDKAAGRGLHRPPSRSVPTTVLRVAPECSTVILQSRKGKFQDRNVPGPGPAAGLELCAGKAETPHYLPVRDPAEGDQGPGSHSFPFSSPVGESLCPVLLSGPGSRQQRTPRRACSEQRAPLRRGSSHGRGPGLWPVLPAGALEYKDWEPHSHCSLNPRVLRLY